MNINRAIHGIISDRGLKINAVARQSGIPEKRLYNILAGSSNMTASELVKLCAHLHLDPLHLGEPAPPDRSA